MNKEFIPYEQALALKELGFDEPCFGRYDGKGKNKGKIWYEMPNRGQETIPVGDVLAPLYQQAFRWFREKYRLTGLVEIGTQEYSFLIFDENTDSREITSSMNGAYEEAELACLKKLIEIVKSQNNAK
jgi:hypothetical protein